MTKADKIKAYNELYNYHITGIKKMTAEQLNNYKRYNQYNSLYELYQKPSQAKIDSYNNIFTDYEPKEIISIQGNCMTYSVILIAKNGSVLHITRDNNYLIEVA